MCSNCRHTGCWIFLGLLYLVSISADGQTVYQPRTSGSDSDSREINLATLSMGSPEVQQIIKVTGSVSCIAITTSFQTITEKELADYVSRMNASGPSISRQALYDFIDTFHGDVSSLLAHLSALVCFPGTKPRRRRK